jgi:hypothetical protein
MSTVKQILDKFCDRINQPRESSYVGATTPAARQYVSLLEFIGDQLIENPNGWYQLKRTYTFTNVLNQANYQLPGDFLRLLMGTQWGVTNQIPLSGPLSNARLAFQTYGVNIATPFPGWQINGAQGYTVATTPYTQKSSGYFQISPPAQDSTSENVIAYTSSNYVWPQDWAPSTAYTAGNIRTGINNIYYCTVSGTSGTTRLSATSGTIVDGTAQWIVYYNSYPITADTDFVLLDDELFIEGMRWAWYESKQQFQAADRYKAMWESSVRSAIGRQNGTCVVNAGTDVNSTYEWPVTAQQGWGPLPS